MATDAKTQAKVKNGALNRKMLVWLKSESRRRLRNVACVSSRRGSALCKGVSCSINESAGASSVVIWGAYGASWEWKELTRFVMVPVG